MIHDKNRYIVRQYETGKKALFLRSNALKCLKIKASTREASKNGLAEAVRLSQRKSH